MLTVAQIKSNRVLSRCLGPGDTKYPQKQGKFTTFEAFFDLHGCFVYIIMLQMFRSFVGNVSAISSKLIKVVYLRL